MSEESKELELVEKRLDVLERTLFGNGHKGLKAELVELKTQIETFKRIAVWQIGILVAILGAVLKNIWWNLVTKLQLIDTIEKALLLVFKDLRILSNSLSLRLKFRATSSFSVSSEFGLIYETTPLFANS